ncbi:atrial natriuretic peptide receptor 1-like [Tubulanus polymorphus]|uniref:atrial natriuretic peptide receptor 1-like n=1 Tax=Tubulanus polymorphus TaxID=672921 RepID=UPI003DA3D631
MFYNQHILISSGLILFLATLTRSWHDTITGNNEDFHCWPLNASATRSTPLDSCTGVNFKWVVPPPDSVKEKELINVTYRLDISDSYYPWAVGLGLFKNVNGTGFNSGSAAKSWCIGTKCPTDPKDADINNCCVYHVNVHSCPASAIESGSLCGPWIPPSGDIFTHSQVLIGNISDGVWTSTILGLHELGVTSIIAHFKVGYAHFALHKQILVKPKTECGNADCESVNGETCENCPADCGKCPMKPWLIAIIAIVAVIIFTLGVCGLAYFIHQRRKMHKLLWDDSWITEFDELRIIYYLFLGEDKAKSMMSMTSTNTGQINSSRQIFTKTAILNGKTMALKQVRKDEFSVNKEIRLEVREYRRLMDHQNICKFTGACVVVPNVYILTEYCNKGSLSDVLLNEEIPLNWAFRFSFLNDIIRGMSHLHSNALIFGNLKSTNCVIDDRWTLKLTDFGLPVFRREDSSLDSEFDDGDDDAINRDKFKIIYTAPEHFQDPKLSATQATDVYAFSVLLFEVANRTEPNGDEYLDELKPGWKPPLPVHPETGDKEMICPCPTKYNQLIQQCSNNLPENRPTFDMIKRLIHQMNPNNQSPVDLMMNMMEKYSKHLEVIVAERTSDLVAEKQKTDRLLYSMLPKAIADELRQGRTINAKMYASCTIYFSDIVGFTTLSGRSSPIQVVGLLNKLYTIFDSIIDEYDVYKVETIGDAYMVVSGVPSENNVHAREISLMSIDIVRACQTFVIPHLPGEVLQIRVGLHTGPVCAGVVGLKMPRYCLFGDTVNTASRMESNGLPYKIHVSSFTKEMLEKLDNFTFERRGTIPVKGKGDMETWWLLDDRDEKINVPGMTEDLIPVET